MTTRSLGYHEYRIGHETEQTTYKDMSSENDVGEDNIQNLLNDTDADLSSLSHLDAPNESVYMICGVLIAMVAVGVIIILLAVVVSKLRKREEHSNSVHPATTEVVLQTQAPTSNNQNNQPADPLAYRGQFLWQYPPPPPLPQVYSNDQDTLVQTMAANGDANNGRFRVFRKNLGGQWRRLVSKKPHQEVYTIPAELKPQLKQIYVY